MAHGRHINFTLDGTVSRNDLFKQMCVILWSVVYRGSWCRWNFL